MFDRRLIVNFDWGYFFLIIIISAIGFINLYSASFTFDDIQAAIYTKQLYWIGLGVLLMFVTFLIDYRQYEQYAYFLYLFCILALILTLIYGRVISGSQRWLDLGLFRVQPSEFMKIAIILSLAKYFHNDREIESYSLKDLVAPLLMIGLPAFLIIKQPDLGSALILLFISLSIIFFININIKSLIILITMGLVVSPFSWFALKDYQKQRILTLFSKELDPLSAGYHTIQSKIAVGSGSLFGKGFMRGTQSQLRFLPEHHTDFIFSVLAEEWGFFGCLIVLVLLLALLLGGLKISTHSKEKFGAIVAFGMTAMIFWQIVVNIGMVIGLLPVVGVTLPLFSYGGSSIVTTFIAFGLLLNISMRRFL
jgi:rod shape determining protein RodA